MPIFCTLIGNEIGKIVFTIQSFKWEGGVRIWKLLLQMFGIGRYIETYLVSWLGKCFIEQMKLQ